MTRKPWSQHESTLEVRVRGCIDLFWTRPLRGPAGAGCVVDDGAPRHLGGHRRPKLHADVHLRAGQAGDQAAHLHFLPLLRVDRHGQIGNIPLSKAAADQYGFILLLPDNPGQNCWDVGTTMSLTHDGGGDTQGLAQMVKYTITKYGADPTRVYAWVARAAG